MVGAVIQFRSLRKAVSAHLSGDVPLRQRHSGVLARLSVLLVVASLVLGTLPGEDTAALPAAAPGPTAPAPFIAGTV